MSSDNNETLKLPDGWVLCDSKSTPGRKYYFNRKTGKSSWAEPQADGKSSDKYKLKRPKPSNRDRDRDRKRKEEAKKKNLKRKSDGNGDHTSTKKKCSEDKDRSRQSLNNSTKNESPGKSDANRRHNTSKQPLQKETDKKENEKAEVKEDTNSHESTGARDSLSSVDSPAKGTPSKNLANSRLAQLRAQLNSDIQMEENKDKSPVKTKRRSPIETDTKVAKTEKSPTMNDSKCTTQSPSSESLHSIPSPSQFFAANKIISSMMAQLPDEYCDKIKQKDTFAEIEQGICSQVNEYPNVKHPVTPPQFSEASKLVSAIKSKLSSKEGTLRTFTTAKERLDVLRTRLSNEAADSSMEDSIMSDRGTFQSEAMDIDCKEIKPSVPAVICTKESVNNNENVVLVVDTNIFIHELDFIKNVLNSHIKGYSEQPTLLVPWRVINELDRLKDNNNGNGAICKRAKSAMDYLYKSLPENERIKGQSLRDANSHIYPCELPDDEILNCCLQQVERGKSVILLTNDKNLCNKACINNVKSIGLGELKTLLESKPQSTTDPDLITGLKHCESAVYQLLANILENEMRAKYNNLWQHVLFKAPPWTLADVLQCLLKHWVAVFSDVFPRIEHLITDLRASLLAIDKKDQNTISQSEVSNFKELCVDIARKCQIIPEYLELAKTTVEQLTRKCDVRDPEMIVIEAFEGVWRILSSYCAKLSTLLGIPHSIEDKMPGEESMDVLTSKFQLFEAQIAGLANAIKSILNVDPLDPCSEEAMSLLEVALKESLTSVQMDNSVVNRTNLTVFCTKCRNMLQEAYTKFAQLTDLLDVCKNTFADA
ncbi:transcriptional protein SWT1 [Manduca sexta]|uniref:WW domain-containing protein n=1 Tax=Manduca sexta TaxID=7130 RepID=A0A921ZMY8_MANSE|nr:transcriptional protein SWT1 [Manduca sexta]KAG6460211.1 hypothetical protein O3G_MSEX011831 [Manduca sexta]